MGRSKSKVKINQMKETQSKKHKIYNKTQKHNISLQPHCPGKQHYLDNETDLHYQLMVHTYAHEKEYKHGTSNWENSIDARMKPPSSSHCIFRNCILLFMYLKWSRYDLHFANKLK